MHPDLFFFGSLRHPPLLEAVIGTPADLRFFDDNLPGYRLSRGSEGPFPGIEKAADDVAVGVRVEGLTPDILGRLTFYERCFEHAPSDAVTAAGVLVKVFLPKPGVWTSAGRWSLEDWIRDWGALSVCAAEEIMSYFGTRSPEEVGAMMPMIRARAASRVRARSMPPRPDRFQGRIAVEAHRRPYARFFALEEFELRHARFDGTMSDTMLRAVFRAPDAALVLPYDPVRDRVLLIEQMRVGPLARGDAMCWHLEPIAGLIDPGETPEQTVRREAQEEAGLTLGALFAVAEAYPSPGNSSEFHYIYVATADLHEGVTGVAGLASEDEDIRSHLLPFDRLLEACDRQEIVNSPLVMATYWLARHRARLRAMA